MDRGAWKLVIHVPESWFGFEILCVSALTYPNLFGTEGLVVVMSYAQFSHWFRKIACVIKMNAYLLSNDNDHKIMYWCIESIENRVMTQLKYEKRGKNWIQGSLTDSHLVTSLYMKHEQIIPVYLAILMASASIEN